MRAANFGAADISLCSGLQVCVAPRSSLPLRILPQGSRGFYVRAERASLPPHAPGMLTVRIQAIDGTRTFTSLDPRPCRPLRYIVESNGGPPEVLVLLVHGLSARQVQHGQ